VADVLRAVARRGADSLARARGQLLPPRSLLARTSSPSPSEFAAAGLVVLDCCRLGGLGPDDTMLDIGSGVGRVAIPLTRYLSPAGRYIGVDMWREGIDWCATTITPRFPNFTFRHLDLHHRQLNPTGSEPIDGTRLPFEDAIFDFAMLGAINHLTAAELLALLAEAGRVLRPGGTYVGTCFLVDEQSAALVPPAAAAVACDEPALHGALASGGLTLVELHRGSWRAGPAPLTYQDVVMARKVSS
jgi:SAM-dependent methyltransferase